MSNLPPPDAGQPPTWGAPPPPGGPQPPAAPSAANPWAPTAATPATEAAPTVVMPGTSPAGAPPTATPPNKPPSHNSKAPMVIGAIVAVLAAAGLAVILTRGGDDAAPSDTTEILLDTTTAQTEATTAPTGAATTAPELVLPTTVAPEPTAAPGTTAAPETVPPPTISIPPGSVTVSDPAGWTLAVDPAWNDTVSNGIRTFFIQPGSTTGDNVNVTTEALPGPVSLDDYVAAAITNIQAAAPDFTIVDQRRISGADGVEMELIGWNGTLAGLPKLAFMQTIVVSPTTAYIATFTSQPDTMPTMAPFLEPFLVTLRGA